MTRASMQGATPSVWDRLAPVGGEGGPLQPNRMTGSPARAASNIEIKQAIRRDLELLLNTRRCYRPLPRRFDAARRSLLMYGIPDFTGAHMGEREQQEEFRTELTRAIRLFESRIQDVQIELIDHAERAARDRVLRFKIVGVIRAHSRREQAVFETHMEPTTCGFAVEGAR